jgi:hypothetical protein
MKDNRKWKKRAAIAICIILFNILWLLGFGLSFGLMFGLSSASEFLRLSFGLTTLFSKIENETMVKKAYSEACLKTSDCISAINLECIDGICDCLTNSYYNGSFCGKLFSILCSLVFTKTIKKFYKAQKIDYNKTCSSSIECKTISCLNQTCLCLNNNYFWDNVTQTCG